MQKISFIKSLMEFQKRVLSQGTVELQETYTLEQLKQILFFNKVFISNTNEMFQKYSMDPVMDDFVEYFDTYKNNIAIIKHQIEKIIPCQIVNINTTSFEQRLEMDKKLPNQIMTMFYRTIENAKSHRFLNGNIYYISLLKDKTVAISFIDPRQPIYKEVFSYKYDEEDLCYWKTDESIRRYLSYQLPVQNVVTVRITTNTKNGKITKVEYSGNTNFMKYISVIFEDHSPAIFKNVYLYTDDIERIIDDNISSAKIVTKSKYRAISIERLFMNELLVEYPNDSFDIYLDFLATVSTYPDTKTIYMTLYRIGSDPAIFYILRQAVLNNIQVIVNLEMYASGEDINKTWLREMLAAGIKVNTYASGELKVHSKLTLVEFTSGKMIAQIGTGNYHTKTVTQYTDLSFITADQTICRQVKDVFNIFDSEYGHEPEVRFDERLLVTRYNARYELVKLIDEEGSKGNDGCIIMKCNALDDDDIIYHLNIASKNGCKINLIVRGVCTWIPEVDNVIVKSIVWDKLEHSRVYSFGNKNPKIYLGSLDLVTNKIDKRIETLVRIDNPVLTSKLCKYLNRYVTTNMGAWTQTSSGMYIKE